MTKQELINTLTAGAVKDYEAGQRDCKYGIYDKWYRYNHKDGGFAYNAGWYEQNRQTPCEHVTILEG